MEPRRGRILPPALALALAVVLVAADSLSAQVMRFKRGVGRDGEPDATESVFIQPERSILQQLSRARELLRQERYGDAVRFLGALLELPEDYFPQADKSARSAYRSLKAEVQQMIGDMPAEGLELYRLQFGPRAQQMLAEAKAAGNMDLVAEVSRRFYHTPAGYEATFLLGLNHFDHARPLAAALILRRLRESAPDAAAFEPAMSLTLASAMLQAGMQKESQDVLADSKQRHAGKALQIAGRDVRWFTKPADAAAWLAALIGPQHATSAVEADRWVMFRGNPARNAQTVGSAPLLNLRWAVPISEEQTTVEALLRQLRQMNTEQDAVLLPSMHPLAVDNVVLMRNLRKLVAVDFATGKEIWEAWSTPAEEEVPGGGSVAENGQPPQAVWGLGQRLWEDATYGTMSSDGRLVYTIDDLPLNLTPGRRNRAMINFLGQQQDTRNVVCNRLVARDIHKENGKIKWQVGGVTDQFGALPLSETFFLGPPLPLMGQLYVLAETKGQGVVSLLALDPDPEPGHRGKLLWSQALASTSERVDLPQDPVRRMAGISPSYAEGILVCPTSVGAIVAVDLASRCLLWGYNYGQGEGNDSQGNAVMFGGFVNRFQQNQATPHRWADAAATIVNGRVLVSPIESEMLYCLNLADGKLVWSLPRKSGNHDDLYLGGVYGDRVILVGCREVRAVSLQPAEKPVKRSYDTIQMSGGARQQVKKEVEVYEPRQLWTVALPEGSTPSGRGFLAGEQYFLPLSSAEVVAVDLKAGRVARTAKSRNGSVPGNLICYHGMVVSQGLDQLEAFFQIDAAREEVTRCLAANAGDAEALSLRGEILWDEGKQTEAVACFRQAYDVFRGAAESEGAERTRTLLRDALLDGLRLKFAEHRGRAAEIEQLLDDDTQRATFLRLMAAGLRQSGEWLAAFEQYGKIIDLDQVNRQTEAVAPGRSVRRDRWIQAEVTALRREVTDAKARAEIDQAIVQRLEAALKSGKAMPLRQFLEYFGEMPADARHTLIERLVRDDRLLEAELVLWSDHESPTPQVAGAAVAELAEMLQKAGRADAAAVCYRRLDREFADVVCRAGKTGRQLVDALPDVQAVRQPAAGGPWPTGLVECKTVALKGARQQNFQRFPFKYDGGPGPFLRDTVVEFDQNRRVILAHDGWGNERWQLSLADAQHQNLFYNRNMSEVHVHGHLVLVSMGYKLLAIDTLGTSGQRGPKLLWDQDLSGATFDAATMQQMQQWQWIQQMQQIQMMQLGGFPGFQFGRFNSRMVPLGSSTCRYVCFQRLRNLVTIDPVSGEVLWAYHNLPSGCELFGDEQYVFAIPPDKDKALVFRALDGQMLGERSVPRSKPSGNNVATDQRGQPLKYLPFNQTCVATLGRRMLVWLDDGKQRVLRLVDPWEAEHSTLWEQKFASGSVVDVVDNEAVAVCEPDGQFALFRLPDGETITRNRLTTEPGFSSLSQVTLLRSPGQYTVVTNNPPRNASGLRQRQVQPLQNMHMISQPILCGWACAFDDHGKQLWPEAVKIESQCLVVDQPRLLPVLVFACQEYVRVNNNAMQAQLAVLCLDKRNGRVVYRTGGKDSVLQNNVATLEIVGDPKQHKVELRLPQNTVELCFTDKPLPPAAAEKSEGKKAEPVQAGKVLDALKNTLGGLRNVYDPRWMEEQ